MKTTEPTKTPSEDILAELRRHKCEIAADHGYDVEALGRDLQRRQQGHPRLVPAPVPADKKSGA